MKAHDLRSAVPALVPAALTAVGLLAAIYVAFGGGNHTIPIEAKAFMVGWLSLAVALSLLLTPRNFTAGFLTSLAAMLIGWRIAGLLGVSLVAWPLLAAFLAYVVQFLDCVRRDLTSAAPKLSGPEWQLTFLRMYVGFDLVPHFTEKLFAGPATFEADVSAFADFGLQSPVFLVLLGGACEFAIMVGFGLGVFTRLAAPCAALYFLVATLDGGHFSKGFIWVSPGGGWEYPVLMMVLYMSFLFTGSGRFSLDGVLSQSGMMPRALMVLGLRKADRQGR